MREWFSRVILFYRRVMEEILRDEARRIAQEFGQSGVAPEDASEINSSMAVGSDSNRS